MFIFFLIKRFKKSPYLLQLFRRNLLQKCFVVPETQSCFPSAWGRVDNDYIFTFRGANLQNLSFKKHNFLGCNMESLSL